MMRFDFETYLPDDILTKVDRMSMAHSIESRVPLLDHGLVTFAASLPASMKIQGQRRKHILKQAVADLLPADLLERTKQGFGVPLGLWFRTDLREVLADTLQPSRVRERGYFQPSVVDRLVQEHLTGRRDHTWRLWQLVMLELWQRQYLDRSLDGRSVPIRPRPLPENGKRIPA
jgi:asparagine synthase (glutamine-hydrolysing)